MKDASWWRLDEINQAATEYFLFFYYYLFITYNIFVHLFTIFTYSFYFWLC